MPYIQIPWFDTVTKKNYLRWFNVYIHVDLKAKKVFVKLGQNSKTAEEWDLDAFKLKYKADQKKLKAMMAFDYSQDAKL